MYNHSFLKNISLGHGKEKLLWINKNFSIWMKEMKCHKKKIISEHFFSSQSKLFMSEYCLFYHMGCWLLTRFHQTLYISLNQSNLCVAFERWAVKDVFFSVCECGSFCMCIRFYNDYPWYVNYPSDSVVHVQTSCVCGFVCFSTGTAAHVCRLMNSLSVCWDAVTRTLKCYLLGLPTLQIKLFPSPQLKSKLRNLPTEVGSKQNVAQRPVLAAIHSAWLKCVISCY